MIFFITAALLSITVFSATYYFLGCFSEKMIYEERAGLVKNSRASASAGEDFLSHPLKKKNSGYGLLFALSGAAALAWWLLNPVNFPLKFVIAFLFAAVLQKGWAFRRIRLQRARIEEELPTTLDLLQLCVEAGMSMNAALVRVADENKKSPLGQLFSRTFHEMNHGIPLEEAFEHLGQNSKVPDVQYFATSVIQAEKLGLSLADNLRNQARIVRETLRTRTREKIQKIPIQMIIPLILFIMPAIFVVVAGPAFIQLRQGFGS